MVVVWCIACVSAQRRERERLFGSIYVTYNTIGLHCVYDLTEMALFFSVDFLLLFFFHMSTWAILQMYARSIRVYMLCPPFLQSASLCLYRCNKKNVLLMLSQPYDQNVQMIVSLSSWFFAFRINKLLSDIDFAKNWRKSILFSC